MITINEVIKAANQIRIRRGFEKWFPTLTVNELTKEIFKITKVTKEFSSQVRAAIKDFEIEHPEINYNTQSVNFSLSMIN